MVNNRVEEQRDGMQTIRQQMMALLSNKEMGARELYQAMGIREKEVYKHLSHIARSAAAQRKGSLSDLSGAWGVDMFFKIGSALPILVAARVAKGHTFKSQNTRSVSTLHCSLSLAPMLTLTGRLLAGNHNRV